MSSPDLASLIAASTTSDRLTLLLQLMQMQNLPVTAWDSGSVGTGFANVDAQAQEDLSGLIAALARSLYIDTATDPDWLRLATLSQYNEDYLPAVFAQGTIVLEDPTGAGPFNIQPGQLYATDASGTLVWINQTGGTLAQGGVLQRSGSTVVGAGSAFVSTWQAESPGVAYNVPSGAIVSLATPLPGVVVSNPAIPPATLWLSQAGADQESMPSLVARCKAKWGSLGYGSPDDAYKTWAKASLPGQITRVAVIPGTPLNGLTVYIGTPAGVPGADVVAAATTYIMKRRPQCVPVGVAPADDYLLDLGSSFIQVRGAAADGVVALAAFKAGLTTLLSTIDIGETLIASDVVTMARAIPNVFDINLAIANVPISSTEIFGGARVKYDRFGVFTYP